MIEVNLLPGAKKAKKGASAGPSINFAAIGPWISARVKDKWLAAAVVTGAIVLAFVGLMFTAQQRRESSLKESEAKEVADSAKYAAVLLDRARAQARRDSALLQLSVIKAIDEDRFIWPHVMDEVSRSLPIYTWLRQLNILPTSPQGVNPAATIKAPPPDTGKTRRKTPWVIHIPKDTVRMQVIGRTVDIEAFTRFMRTLEDSPFFEAVTFLRSQPTIEGGKEIYQFTIELTYSRPDSLMLQRAPFTLPSQR